VCLLAAALALYLGACQAPPASASPEKKVVAAAPAAPSAKSDALLAPRPAGGEYFGLYLMGKKVGYIFTDLAPVPQAPDRVQSINQFFFKANVGSKVSERQHREIRIYEAKPGGKLLSFTIDQKGDGGNQLLEGTASAGGVKVIRKRPGMADESLTLKPTQETVEDADQARVALFRGKALTGMILDGQELESYSVTTTPKGQDTKLIGGVQVKVRKVVTISEKEKVPVEAYIDTKGRTLQIDFGTTMRAIGESEPVAKRLDQVEVFGLTRVVLPKPVSPEARKIPGTLKLVVTGLPDRFHRSGQRQKFRKLAGDDVEVTLSASAPKEKPRPLPLTDPSGGANLKASIIVEADNPEIKALAKQLTDGAPDAYAAAKKINAWVYQNLVKDYGSSADRASDVLRQKRGDCTEHSLLAVALMRAAGIPAKRVDGVVYMMNDDKVPALYWHEWVEAFVGEWTQLDPTFGQEVADATHFAVGEEGNAEITPLIGQLKVVDVR
jgi:hypothetical protein